MVQVAEGRVRDIHALNRDFLNIVAESDAGENYGVSEEVTQYIKSCPRMPLSARTDVLLFQAEEPLAGNEQAEKNRSVGKTESRGTGFRAQAYPGLAECHLRMKPLGANSYVMLGTSQIQEYSCASKENFRLSRWPSKPSACWPA